MKCNMNIKCLFGFHQYEIVLNIKTNKITKICKKCKKILEVEQKGICCTSCNIKDALWRIKLRKEGKVINEM